MLLERAGVRPGMCVLDAGCGPGRVTLPAAARVGPSGRVIALDLQPAMLTRLGARLATAGVANVEPFAAGLGEGRLGDDRFDVVLLVTVLGEIPDKVAALREIVRALRPGGVLSVTEVLPDPHYQSMARVRGSGRRGGPGRGRAAPRLVLVHHEPRAASLTMPWRHRPTGWPRNGPPRSAVHTRHARDRRQDPRAQAFRRGLLTSSSHRRAGYDGASPETALTHEGAVEGERRPRVWSILPRRASSPEPARRRERRPSGLARASIRARPAGRYRIACATQAPPGRRRGWVSSEPRVPRGPRLRIERHPPVRLRAAGSPRRGAPPRSASPGSGSTATNQSASGAASATHTPRPPPGRGGGAAEPGHDCVYALSGCHFSHDHASSTSRPRTAAAPRD